MTSARPRVATLVRHTIRWGSLRGRHSAPPARILAGPHDSRLLHAACGRCAQRPRRSLRRIWRGARWPRPASCAPSIAQIQLFGQCRRNRSVRPTGLKARSATRHRMIDTCEDPTIRALGPSWHAAVHYSIRGYPSCASSWQLCQFVTTRDCVANQQCLLMRLGSAATEKR